MKRVNIALKEQIHTQAKIIAVLKTMTLNDYLTKAIEKSVDKHKNLIEKFEK
jgi:hypothetical protein